MASFFELRRGLQNGLLTTVFEFEWGRPVGEIIPAKTPSGRFNLRTKSVSRIEVRDGVCYAAGEEADLEKLAAKCGTTAEALRAAFAKKSFTGSVVEFERI